MNADLERILERTEGEGPSADFLRRTRQRIVEESEDQTPVDASLIPIELRSEAERSGIPSRRWPLVVAAAAALILILGVVSLVRPETEGPPVRTDPPNVEDTPLVEDTPVEPGPPTLPGTLFTGTNSLVEAGTHQIDTLGTPLAFIVDETTGVTENELGTLVVADLLAANRTDRSVTFQRWTALVPPDDLTAPFGPDDEGWPVDDLTGWIDGLDPRVTATEPEPTVVGGRNALRVDLTIGDLECVPQVIEGCGVIGTNSHVSTRTVRNEGSYRLWLVDFGAEDPLAIVAAVHSQQDNASWFDTADAIVARLEFGAIGPNPIRVVGAGDISLSIAGGIDATVAGRTVITETANGATRLNLDSSGVLVELLHDPLDTGGSPATTSDRVVSILTEAGVRVTERATVTVDGITARVLGIESGSSPRPLLKYRPAEVGASGIGWRPPSVGMLWIVEHPDAGLVLVSAPAGEGAAAIAGGFVESIRFATNP